MSSSPPHFHIGEASTSRGGNGTGNGDGNGNGNENERRRRRRRRQPPSPPPPRRRPPIEGPSTSTYHEVFNGGVWPEPFVEALFLQTALQTSLSHGRLAVAPALAILFQVCTTWRTVSRSELLWQNLVRLIWNRTIRQQPTWRDEFIYHHRTAVNFRFRRCSYAALTPSPHHHPPPPDDGVNQIPLFCLRLSLATDYLAAGFSDGTVRLFYLPNRLHVRTLRPLVRDRLGLFSRAVSGIVLLPTIDQLVFASLDGDIHVSAPLVGPDPTRRAYLGDVVNDGALVDFSGCERFWVGLYAGVPGRAIRVWNAVSEELVFVDGSLTDPESLMGWRMLTELRPTEVVGRVRILPNGLAIGFTATRVLVLDLEAHAAIVREEASRRVIIVGSTDANDDAFVTVDTRGVGSVRSTHTWQEICRLDRAPLRGGPLRGLLGCMNRLYAVMCTGGVVRVWDCEHGEYLYSLMEGIGEVAALAVDDRHVAASSGDTLVHLWDFGG